MSTATMLVHVPVDSIEIVHGSLTEDDLFFFIGSPEETKSIDMKVTLRTSASGRTFTRTITITSAPRMVVGRRAKGYVVPFIGTFAGQPIEGTYNTRSRKGNYRLAD